jgi:DNA-binding transcriptional ArsR family regulator
MSLGDKKVGAERAALRALAHPIRLQILSLLTGAPMTAAEVARELGLTHANASYHLRSLAAGGAIVPAGEEKIRGGVAKRYRYDAAGDTESVLSSTGEQRQAMIAAGADELIRRVIQLDTEGKQSFTDAELWVDPEVWTTLRHKISALAIELHQAARPPRTPGTVRTSTTIAMFTMKPGEPR